MGHVQSKVDHCMYYSRFKNKEVTIIQSWVDDNNIMGPYYKRIKIGNLNVGPLNKFVGCNFKMDHTTKTSKLTQHVTIQSFNDEFDAGRTKYMTPAEAITVLQKVKEDKDKLEEEDQTKYCSGVGKFMHMIRWTMPDI